MREASKRFDIPILRVVRGDGVLDIAVNPVIERGDIVTVIADNARLVRISQLQPALTEVADERALQVDIEIADLVVTRREYVGMTLEEASKRFRRKLFPEERKWTDFPRAGSHTSRRVYSHLAGHAH